VLRKPKELTREQCIESVKFLELAKFEANIKLFEMMQTQQISGEMI
jgi:hypothetical protein